MLPDVEYDRPTANGELRYKWTHKHHGGGKSDDSRWAEDLSIHEEFGVFDEAVGRAVAVKGHFYGVMRQGKRLRTLGTWDQQVAKFPRTLPPHPWHGYPVYPVVSSAPQCHQGDVNKPSNAVFELMAESGMISETQKQRLKSGRHL